MAFVNEVSGNELYHIYFIDLEIAGTTYYITDSYTEHTFMGNVYTPLGELMDVGAMTYDINPGPQTVTITVSGVGTDRDFKALTLTGRSKGGNVKIYRGVSSTSMQDILNNDKIYQMYSGYVKSIAYSEDFPQVDAAFKDLIIFECSTLVRMNKERVNGRRCNPEDFNEYNRFVLGIGRDKGMDRVAALNGKRFAFGRTA